MSKVKYIVLALVILALYLVSQETIINIISNVTSFMRNDNKEELYDSAYKEKIETLEKELYDYEKAMGDLSIYEGYSYVLGKVSLRNIYDIYDYVVVSTSALVDVQDAVINEDGLVGFVKDASLKTAKIDLLTRGVKVSVKVGENYGILSNYDKRTNTFTVSNIDNYKVVEAGDEVVTSGLQEVEEGIRIGKVISAEVKGIEKEIKVRPYVDYKNLNYLLIMNR